MPRTLVVESMTRGYVPVAIAAILLAGALIPLAGAQHCESRINVYGRVLVAPLAPPPYASATYSVCVRLYNNVVSEHSLPPNTDQIYVRVNGDFGPSIERLRATIDGLGFPATEHYLYRTNNQFGGYTYNIADWLELPNGPTDGTLTVTVYYPGNVPFSVTYHTTATVVPPQPTFPNPPTVPTI